MNYKKILSIFALSSLLFSSCDDQKMEWYDDPTHGDVTIDELPLKLAEKISRYDALKTYTDITLGVGVGMELYMTDDTYRTLAEENFDELTVGYAMKHGPMVNSKGEVEFEAADAFMAKTQEAGLSVFGHTLVWHSNQNASYLNGLIAPTVIPGSGGSNSLDISGLQDGTFAGWNLANVSDGITVVEGAGLSSEAKAVQLIASATASNPWNLQLITPDIPVVSGHNYEISFFIKSDQAGKGRLSFSGLVNNYPWKDWYATGGSWTEAFETSTQWQQVKITVNDFNDVSFKIAFDLGYLPGVTYYIDVDNVKVTDLDAPVEEVNFISNGDFESATLDPWGGWGNSSTREVSAEGEGFGGTGYCMVLTNPSAANLWSAQQVYWFDSALEQDKEYTCTFMIKASTAAAIQLQLQSDDYSANYYGGISVGAAWSQVSLKMTPTTADRTKFVIDFGETAATYYIDDIVLTDGSTGTSGPTIIEKTDEEKAQIIEDSMTSWISQMVGHYKDGIFAWDVVNEPMRESGEVRDGNVSDPAADEFYWQKYMGKDYAVKAFNLARQYGNATDVLFINDYNLETNHTKLDGLISYVQYIEQQGAQVDGIGTQMHISADTDKDMIAGMFEKLAASGKLIKVSELDVRLGTKNPTAEQLAAQAEMYQYVIDMFMQYIPEAQRYGITIWGISDSEQEHEYWLPEESPNLWDANYNRKHAYKGAADGLAGKDVSEDFSGALDY
ncbi:endo-1,4-beta-xylanase [Carboxylicivirga caseinilyticus]|uniref:endo-1,4-beta-xylanase n=1 Tax=Carboxylicivirga caseinilyticus TaxID=3417572 RepID=UPI003D34A2C1|nr:endo-1,4-beta-xylanase [Marinilabiliaceae bacterium A049]